MQCCVIACQYAVVPRAYPSCSVQSGLCLAVLHHHKVVVFSVAAPESGGGAAGSYFKLSRLYEHVFTNSGAHFSAFNMTYGPFGSGTGGSGGGAAAALMGGGAMRDALCVQSMDGQLAVYEQASGHRGTHAGAGARDSFFLAILICTLLSPPAPPFAHPLLQERFAFRRQLDACLLPGPIAYVSRTDSLVTVTSELVLDSYRCGGGGRGGS
jgi:hypothetical protein